MKNIIASILMGIALLIPTNFSENKEIYNNIEKIEVIIDSEVKVIDKDSKYLKDLVNICGDMLQNAHEMPAFSVSLDNETRVKKNNGTWVEIYFIKTLSHNELPFDRLLIEIEPEWTGFNIIRYYENKYEGRCFYIDLVDKDMSKLYKMLNNI